MKKGKKDKKKARKARKRLRSKNTNINKINITVPGAASLMPSIGGGGGVESSYRSDGYQNLARVLNTHISNTTPPVQGGNLLGEIKREVEIKREGGIKSEVGIKREVGDRRPSPRPPQRIIDVDPYSALESKDDDTYGGGGGSNSNERTRSFLQFDGKAAPVTNMTPITPGDNPINWVGLPTASENLFTGTSDPPPTRHSSQLARPPDFPGSSLHHAMEAEEEVGKAGTDSIASDPPTKPQSEERTPWKDRLRSATAKTATIEAATGRRGRKGLGNFRRSSEL